MAEQHSYLRLDALAAAHQAEEPQHRWPIPVPTPSPLNPICKTQDQVPH
jgi:hypothetical protein